MNENLTSDLKLRRRQLLDGVAIAATELTMIRGARSPNSVQIPANGTRTIP